MVRSGGLFERYLDVAIDELQLSLAEAQGVYGEAIESLRLVASCGRRPIQDQFLCHRHHTGQGVRMPAEHQIVMVFDDEGDLLGETPASCEQTSKFFMNAHDERPDV